MKKIALAMTIGLATARLLAQQPTAAPLPPGPILGHAPEFSRWLIQMTYKEARSPEVIRSAVERKAVDFDIREKSILVSKSRDVVSEQIEDEAGRKTTTWCKGNHHVSSEIGTAKLIWLSRSQDQPFFTNYDVVAFPGFEWLRREFLTGIQKHGDQDAYVFRDEGGKRTAYLSVEGQLPLELETPEGKRVYKYQAMPSELQVVPPAYQTELDRWTKAEANFQVHPPKP